MKNILIHGKWFRTYAIQCHDCECQFTYETEDIIDIHGEHPWVRCPECDVSIEHDESKVVMIRGIRE